MQSKSSKTLYDFFQKRAPRENIKIDISDESDSGCLDWRHAHLNATSSNQDLVKHALDTSNNLSVQNAVEVKKTVISVSESEDEINFKPDHLVEPRVPSRGRAILRLKSQQDPETSVDSRACGSSCSSCNDKDICNDITSIAGMPKSDVWSPHKMGEMYAASHMINDPIDCTQAGRPKSEPNKRRRIHR